MTVSGGPAICSNCVKSSTLSNADSTRRRHQWRAGVQLKLAIFDLTDPPQNSEAPSHAPTPWDQVHDTSRVAALALLARLIARMLAAAPAKDVSDE